LIESFFLLYDSIFPVFVFVLRMYVFIYPYVGGFLHVALV
jgi:hypothetical protein